MKAKTVVAAPPAAEPAKVDAGSSPVATETPVRRGTWTRDVEALCRALEAQQRAAQQRAHFPVVETEEE